MNKFYRILICSSFLSIIGYGSSNDDDNNRGLTQISHFSDNNDFTSFKIHKKKWNSRLISSIQSIALIDLEDFDGFIEHIKTGMLNTNFPHLESIDLSKSNLDFIQKKRLKKALTEANFTLRFTPPKKESMEKQIVCVAKKFFKTNDFEFIKDKINEWIREDAPQAEHKAREILNYILYFGDSNQKQRLKDWINLLDETDDLPMLDIIVEVLYSFYNLSNPQHNIEFWQWIDDLSQQEYFQSSIVGRVLLHIYCDNSYIHKNFVKNWLLQSNQNKNWNERARAASVSLVLSLIHSNMPLEEHQDIDEIIELFSAQDNFYYSDVVNQFHSAIEPQDDTQVEDHNDSVFYEKEE